MIVETGMFSLKGASTYRVLISGLGLEGEVYGNGAAEAAPFDYSVAGFTLSASQKRASFSHFLEQNVCVSRALLVLMRYWE